MTKLQQVNKIVSKMLNKHENQRRESRNVVIDRKFTKKDSKMLNCHEKYEKKQKQNE